MPVASAPAARARAERRGLLRQALVREPLLTDADLARRLGVSVPTVRLDRVALGIPEVRDRARAVAERHLQPSGAALHGEVVDLLPGVSALALLPPDALRPEDDAWPRDCTLFGDAEALALAASGMPAGSVEVVNCKFRRSAAVAGRLVAKAEVLRGREAAGGVRRRVVLVQIRAGEATLLRAKFVVAGAPPDAVPPAGLSGDGARPGGA